MKTICLVFISALFFHTPGQAHGSQPHIQTFTYKIIDTVSLDLQVVSPEKRRRNRPLPAVVFFFGGGWARDNINQFMPHCTYLADLGVIGILVEYRVNEKHGTAPQDAIEDAKSAMRWIRAHANDLGIKSNRIIASGGSAGGHLAACTATLSAFNAPSDDLSIDPTPDALILFNPVLANLNFYELFGGEEEAIDAAPVFHITEKTPPTIIFHGTEDKVVPVSVVLEFQKKMISLGNTCEVILFGNESHAFFNEGRNGDRPYHQTLVLMKQFLIEEGFLDQ